MLWFISQDGKTEGPLPDQRIAQLVRWGKISRSAYICDEQLSNWVSIQRTAFAPLLHPAPPHPPAEVDSIRPLGALRGGPWRLSTRAAQRLGGVVAVAGVLAGALQLASGLATSRRSESAAQASTPARLPAATLRDTPAR